MRATVVNRVVFVLALAGAGVAGYLTLVHLDVTGLGCSVLHGCEEVNSHYTASGFGIPALKAIPTAAFGLAMYAFMAGACFVRAVNSRASWHRTIGLAQWLVAISGVAVSAWLTHLEAHVIHAWCQWCIISALITVAMCVALTFERFTGRGPAAQSLGVQQGGIS